MKISVSLPERDVSFLDDYRDRTAAESRSAVIHAAIELLRESQLEADYAAAWDEWSTGPDAEFWETTVADGTADAAR